MAGRPPKPTALLLLQGAEKKNPKRIAARQGEPIGKGPLGDPPEHFMLSHPDRDAVVKLFGEGKSLNDVSIELGIPPEVAQRLRPGLGNLYDLAAARRELWYQCSDMWPWLTGSDRHTVEDICDLRYKARNGTISAGERNVLRALTNAVGGDGSGRARLGVKAGGGKAPGPTAVDPRASFMKRRQG